MKIPQHSAPSSAESVKLPSAWQWLQLAEICLQDRRIVEPGSAEAASLSYLSLEHIESNTGRVLRKTAEPASDEGRSTTFAFDQRHVLYGKLRPYLNKVALPDFRGRCTTELIPLLPRTDKVTREYLANLLRRAEVVAAAMQGKTGSRMPRADMDSLMAMRLPIPPLPDQRRIAARLREQLAGVAKARAAVQAQLDASNLLIHAILRGTLTNGRATPTRIADCLTEVTDGIGSEWSQYPVLGATRAGLALAKEPVGKNPGRYKPVRQGTVFYNPMRILLGSIAMLDEDDAPGITSPDYVVMNAVENQLSPRWFYYWFRSSYGAEFIKSMTRGAVRERLMFRRLAPATIQLPDWTAQQAADRQFAEIKRTQKTLTEQQTALDHLPAALLREAFNGRV